MKKLRVICYRYFLIFLILGFTVIGCKKTTQKPSKNTKRYQTALTNFYVSLTAIQTDHAPLAIKKMQEVADMYPEEPAVWANLCVYAMRQSNFDQATAHIKKALNLANNNAQIQFLAGILESRKGNIRTSLNYFQRAVRLDSTNPKAYFKLVKELERIDAQTNTKQINELFDKILELDPHNLAVLVEKTRFAAKKENQDELQQNLKKIESRFGQWPEGIKNQFEDLKSTILQKEGKGVSYELAFLHNLLKQIPAFKSDLQKVLVPPEKIGFLVSKFIWLPNPTHTIAPLDEHMKFVANETDQTVKKLQIWKKLALTKNKKGTAISVYGNRATVGTQKLDFPSDDPTTELSPNAMDALDYNYDFKNDLIFAGPKGFRLYKQNDDSSFTNVTTTLGLSSYIQHSSYTGVWAYDFDLDGDLDLLLSDKKDGSIVLQNNGHGTFKVRSYFDESSPIRDFLWGDFDRDGDPDAAVLTGNNEVHYYRNNRGTNFHQDSVFSLSGGIRAINFGDINSDGIFEIVCLTSDQIFSTSYVDSTDSWNSKLLVQFAKKNEEFGTHPQLFISDLDNNGGLDVLISEQNNTRYWLMDKDFNLSPETHYLSGQIFNLYDANDDSRLDLAGLNAKGHSEIWINRGSKKYHGQIVRPRASGPLGDQRINSFGIGGEIESRTALQYVKQPINKPWVHIGLGTYKKADMVRIRWPNGSVQAEFAELGYNSKIENRQILKGSCPWVFTYNGRKMEFITDFLWRTALGLKINLQGKSNVIHSIDWIKIDGNQLQPRNGFYDVRITADLWESHFFDHVSLLAVDHPKYTDVFVDERFKLPAPKQKLYPMKKVYPIKRVIDQSGRDITQKVAKKDANYVHSFPLTSYQGLAQDHYIEVELGIDKVTEGEEKLLAYGWVYPTDTSINIAINQHDHKPLYGVRVEVPDGKGGWKIVQKDMGFPSGKNKTMIINLDGIFEPGTPHKVRLYTNMEIYWDQIRLGIQDNDIKLKTHKIQADSAKLQYRGFSKLDKKERFFPTRPNYQKISGTTAKWFDLIGFYTRYGTVKELTKRSDDRYVIMNAGDELAFKFPALPTPRKGWTRDFALVGDGWIKDGDLNTDHSKTVLPLPYHGMKDYSKEPGLLQDDPVYQKHKQDWIKYHTRFVSPHSFNTSLIFQKH